jgi:flagellar hook-length control protein FliK
MASGTVRPAPPQGGGAQNAKAAVPASATPASVAAPAAAGFSVQAPPVAAPAPYTAQAVPAPDSTAAAQVPASTLSQTAVQTLSALSMQISKRLDDGNTRFTVELHPADLGRVDVALTIDRDGKVNAHLNFDTPITAAAFSAHQSELRQQLTQAGLNVDSGSLTFSSRQEGGSAQTGQNPSGQGGFMNQQQNPQHSQSGQSQSSPSGAGDAARALAAAGQANDAADLGLSNLIGQGGSLALNLIV